MRYPPRYIHNQFTKFSSSHSSPTFILPRINSRTIFALIRSVLVSTLTIPEYQMDTRIARSLKHEPQQTVDNLLMRVHLRKQNTYDTNFTIHYTHEKRLTNHKRQIHQLWNQQYILSSALETIATSQFSTTSE